MAQQRITRIASATIASLGMLAALTGAAAAAPNTNGYLHNTGPSSTNKVKTYNSSWYKVKNNNNLSVSNSNHQSASTGSANVSGNTKGGHANSGAAWNNNTANTSVTVKNNTGGGSGGGSGGSNNTTNAKMTDTGPHSYNSVKTVNKSSTYIQNNNDVTVTNSNNQTANSGSANVSGNTHGGSATSGDASNTNSSSTTLNISN